MGFPKTAEQYSRIWQRIYPNPRAGNIPTEVLETFGKAHKLVVDTICYTPYSELGGKTLAEVSGFKPHHQRLIEEAGERLAKGIDQGIVRSRKFSAEISRALTRKLFSRPSIKPSWRKRQTAKQTIPGFLAAMLFRRNWVEKLPERKQVSISVQNRLSIVSCRC